MTNEIRRLHEQQKPENIWSEEEGASHGPPPPVGAVYEINKGSILFTPYNAYPTLAYSCSTPILQSPEERQQNEEILHDLCDKVS
jgi:hypothetical protein